MHPAFHLANPPMVCTEAPSSRYLLLSLSPKKEILASPACKPPDGLNFFLVLKLGEKKLLFCCNIFYFSEMFLFVGVQIQCVETSRPQIGEISCACPWCFASNQRAAMFGLPIRRARGSKDIPIWAQLPHLPYKDVSLSTPTPAPLRKIHKGRGKYTPSLPPCQRLLYTTSCHFPSDLNLLIRASKVGP